MEMIKINFKKIILYILIIIVSFLVMTAFYFNRYKFSGINTIKYKTINIEDETNIDELALRFSDNITREKFVSETERINNINSLEYIPGNSVLIIPIIKHE
jgi:Na+(H+)/acetate symporter ActP